VKPADGAEAKSALFSALRLPNDISTWRPSNTAPFSIRIRELLDALEGDTSRRQLLFRLLRGIQEQSEIKILYALVGGSFTDLNSAIPRDLDCLLFYKSERSANCTCHTQDLRKLRHRLFANGIDARLTPVDAGPEHIVSLTAFCSLLYSQFRVNDIHAAPRRLLLIELN
jgi:hypothetical protein